MKTSGAFAIGFCLILAIVLASPANGATTYTTTINANASGTIGSGNVNCGSGCSALGVCNVVSGINTAVLVRFDLSNLPSTATIYSASLTLPVKLTGTGSPTLNAYAVSANWVAPTGTSNNNPCVGAAPVAGEPTYEDQVFPTTAWSAAAGQTGASLIALSPFSNQVGDTFATQRSSATFLTLVKSWASNPSTNFGIVIVGPNATSTDTKVFFGTPTLTYETDQFIPTPAPIKSVTYTPPTYNTGTRTPSGTYIPTRYTSSTTNGAVIGGVIGGLAAVILIIAIATAIFRGGSSSSSYRYRSRY